MGPNLERYSGIDQFGPAYRRMLELDPHAPGSVDRELMKSMVRLCRETADWLYGEFTPTRVPYDYGSRAELERYVEDAVGAVKEPEDQVDGIAAYCAALGDYAPDDPARMLVGGTEEEIIRRGSDWCTDVARVACAMCQVLRMPARIVYLADTERAYSGHAVIEAYREDEWGAVDAVAGIVYRSNARPASVWDLMKRPEVIRRHGPHPYAVAEQYRAAAVANYFIWESHRYDYAESRLNQYSRDILEHSRAGWPQGLRWLHGEGE